MAGAKATTPEKVWRKRFQDQRDKIAAAEKELDILQREDDKAQVQYYNDPTKAMNEQYTRKDINDKNAKIDQKKQQIADLKKQLDDMEDESAQSLAAIPAGHVSKIEIRKSKLENRNSLRQWCGY